MAIALEQVTRLSPSGVNATVLQVSGASTGEGVNIASLNYPAGQHMVFSVWWYTGTAGTTVTVNAQSQTETVEVPTTWERYHIVNTTPRGNNVIVYPSSGATIYFYMAQLEMGDSPSDWRPAPEDGETEIDSLKQRVSAAEQKITPTAIVGTVTQSTEWGDLETEVDQQGAAISAKASQTDVDAQEGRIEVAETVIKETPTGVDIVVSSTNVFKGVTQQDETTVEITDSSFIVNTDVVDLQGANNQSLHIDGDGAVMDVLTVNQNLSAPNIVEKYTGSATMYVGENGDYNSLQGAVDQINAKYLPYNVNVVLQEDINGYVKIEGIMGPGQLVIKSPTGERHTLQGNIRINGCTASVMLQNFDVSYSGCTMSSYAINIESSIGVYLSDMNLTGPYSPVDSSTPASILVNIDWQSTVSLSSVRMDGTTNLIYLDRGSNLDCYNLAGEGTYYLNAGMSRITMSGTRPVGSYRARRNNLISPADPNTLNTDGGSGGGGETPIVVGTATMTATTTASFGNNWNNGNDMMQGYVGRTGYKGCAWFTWSVPSGMAIKTAALTIKRKSSAGRSGEINVHMWVTPNPSSIITGDTDPMPSDQSQYDMGIIGTMTPGETATFAGGDIMTVASALNRNPTWGIMICTEETSPMSGRDYSANYCRIEGTDGAAPILEVTYTNQDEEG